MRESKASRYLLEWPTPSGDDPPFATRFDTLDEAVGFKRRLAATKAFSKDDIVIYTTPRLLPSLTFRLR